MTTHSAGLFSPADTPSNQRPSPRWQLKLAEAGDRSLALEIRKFTPLPQAKLLSASYYRLPPPLQKCRPESIEIVLAPLYRQVDKILCPTLFSLPHLIALIDGSLYHAVLRLDQKKIRWEIRRRSLALKAGDGR